MPVDLLRLFAAACCGRVYRLLGDDRSQYAVHVANQYARGGLPDAALAAAHDLAREALQEREDANDPAARIWAARAAVNVTAPVSRPFVVAEDARLACGPPALEFAERLHQDALFACVVGETTPYPSRDFPSGALRAAWACRVGEPAAAPVLADLLGGLGEGVAAGHLRGQLWHTVDCCVLKWITAGPEYAENFDHNQEAVAAAHAHLAADRRLHGDPATRLARVLEPDDEVVLPFEIGRRPDVKEAFRAFGLALRRRGPGRFRVKAVTGWDGPVPTPLVNPAAEVAVGLGVMRRERRWWGPRA